MTAPDPEPRHATALIVEATRDKMDAAAQAAADERAAKAPGKREPPSWAKLRERAAAIKLKIVGPLSPGGQTHSAGIETVGDDWRRLASCQAHDREGLMPDRADRILRSQLGAALWVLEGEGV